MGATTEQARFCIIVVLFIGTESYSLSHERRERLFRVPDTGFDQNNYVVEHYSFQKAIDRVLKYTPFLMLSLSVLLYFWIPPNSSIFGSWGVGLLGT